MDLDYFKTIWVQFRKFPCRTYTRKQLRKMFRLKNMKPVDDEINKAITMLKELGAVENTKGKWHLTKEALEYALSKPVDTNPNLEVG